MAHPDLDSLLDPLFSFAREQLAKRGGFYPFGASIKSDGQFAMAAAYAGRRYPHVFEVLDLLVAGFKQEAAAGAIRAAGVCLDMRMTLPNTFEESDTICAQLEQVEGQCVEVHLPYKKGWFGRLKFGEIFATPAESRIFAAPGEGPGWRRHER